MSISSFVDAPGPRARRRQRILTVALLVVLAVVVFGAYRRLDARGQFDGRRWEVFQQWSVWRFYLYGLGNTLKAAAVSAVGALGLGMVFALGRSSPRRASRVLSMLYVETFRAAPLILLMFFARFALPKIGIGFVNSFWAVVIGLVAYNSAVFAEIFRAGIASLPKGQFEAAASIGLRHGQVMAHVVVPQAVRAMLPALVAQLVVLLKDTSFGALLNYEELLRRGQITGEFAKNPLQALFVAAVLYAPVIFVLNRLARRLERRRRGPAAPVTVDGALLV
ncbi:MAG: amino acid ABC transporter permease [Acidimicrobiales bacterium]|nr:amino acid ABC transporter permease [Acidimicrobiales bacterium]